MNYPEAEKNKKLKNFVESVIGPLPDLFTPKEGQYNIYSHCLMEAARACVFSDILGFDRDLAKDMILAALLHDGHKQLEIQAMREAVDNRKSIRNASNLATQRYLEKLKEKNISSRAIGFIGLVGGAPEVLVEVKKILEKKALSPEELAGLVMHYIDDYTIGSEWVAPAEIASDGTRINDIDRRMAKNKNNSNYKEISLEDARIFSDLGIFGGMGSFEAMAFVSHGIEKRLLSYPGIWTGIDASAIPEKIDEEIMERLSSSD